MPTQVQEFERPSGSPVESGAPPFSQVGLVGGFLFLAVGTLAISSVFTVLGCLLAVVAPAPLALLYISYGNARSLGATALVLVLVGLLGGVLGIDGVGLLLLLAWLGISFGVLHNLGLSFQWNLAVGSVCVAGLLTAGYYGTWGLELSRSARRQAAGEPPTRGAPPASPAPGSLAGPPVPDPAPTAATPASRDPVTVPGPAATPRGWTLKSLLKSVEEQSQHHDPEALRWALVWWLQCPVFPLAVVALLLYGGVAWVMRWVLREVGLPDARVDDFPEWTVPWWYSWLVILTVIPLVLSMSSRSVWWSSFFTQFMLAVMLPYMVVSFSIATHFVHRWQFNPVLRFLIYMAVLFYSPYLSLFTLLDPWVDYRRLHGPWMGEDDEDDEDHDDDDA